MKKLIFISLVLLVGCTKEPNSPFDGDWSRIDNWVYAVHNNEEVLKIDAKGYIFLRGKMIGYDDRLINLLRLNYESITKKIDSYHKNDAYFDNYNWKIMRVANDSLPEWHVTFTPKGTRPYLGETSYAGTLERAIEGAKKKMDKQKKKWCPE